MQKFNIGNNNKSKDLLNILDCQKYLIKILLVS